MPQTKTVESLKGVEILIGESEIKGLIKADSFQPSSVDPLGYDLRLGTWVKLVTRGEERLLDKPDSEVEIYPDETVLVTSEETLCLPPNVFATGSPKMSLLLQGLWAHGGKTDFGYSSQMAFGFRHHGAKPITLRRGQPIFHLTFWQVHGKETKPGSNKFPKYPSVTPSALENMTSLPGEKDVKVRDRDGLQSHRMIRAVGRHVKRMRGVLSVVALLAAVLIAANTLGSSWSVLRNNADPINVSIGILTLGTTVVGLFWPIRREK